MKSFFVLLVGLALGVAGVIGGYYFLKMTPAGDEGVTLVFTEAEIQKKLGDKFPKKDRILEIIPYVIEKPTVRFLGETDRIELSVKARIEIPLMKATEAKGIFTSSIKYKPEDQTLRISKVTIENFESESIPKKYEDEIQLALTGAARALLEDHVVHTLDPKDHRQELAGMLLKKLRVKEGRLEITLGL